MPLTIMRANASGMDSVEVGSTQEFDPKSFNVTARRTFHDLKIGEIYRLPSRTVTEAQFAAFQVVSGDNHPIHQNSELVLTGEQKYLLRK
jgi:acyl dehydratase